ncbi:Fic family protein [Methanococcus maripaludis]|uniref:Adenosine monophosphate-protein transferase SoFic n=1 Tax=Methanococcus maripaludis TaxID=39152 RepID=A0A2L1C994_METMI|nr:Fic family protein [Methanococcus maripaludis]AVB75889.1 Adenosine monophosphate-protein transferase SoFic [Methanococcus maripaludis]MBA2864364.1 Fic family protein [Methanococcus maripaludis]MBB6497289.1 Fic family protein [Methanococcus maripaludis]
MKLPEIPKYSKENIDIAIKYVPNREIIDIVQKYNEKYLHFNELKHKTLPIDPVIIWTIMKMFRMNNLKSIHFGKWTFNYSLIDEFIEKLHTLDKSASGNLSTALESIPSEKERYIIDSLMEEAIASSQIEGAVTTRKVAKEMLKKGQKPKNKDQKMILNNYNTMKYILEIKNKEFSISEILKIHKIITDGTLEDPEFVGKFRKNNEIAVYSTDGTLLHEPPKYELVESLMNNLCEFSNSKDKFIHPIIKGIIIHFLIGYIHPFNDGNGITARSLFYWYLLKNDYWLFEYMAISRVINGSKGQYRDAYLKTESDTFYKDDKGDLTYFIKYNLECICRSLDEILDYLSKKQVEQKEVLNLINKSEDLNLRQAEILKEILKTPENIITIKEIVTTYNVAYATGRADLNHLVELGYLEKKKAGKEFVYVLNKK